MSLGDSSMISSNECSKVHDNEDTDDMLLSGNMLVWGRKCIASCLERRRQRHEKFECRMLPKYRWNAILKMRLDTLSTCCWNTKGEAHDRQTSNCDLLIDRSILLNYKRFVGSVESSKILARDFLNNGRRRISHTSFPMLIRRVVVQCRCLGTHSWSNSSNTSFWIRSDDKIGSRHCPNMSTHSRWTIAKRTKQVLWTWSTKSDDNR